MAFVSLKSIISENFWSMIKLNIFVTITESNVCVMNLASLAKKNFCINALPSQVLMATNRPDTLDPALMRPGRLDRKVEFGLPDLEGRAHIFKIHAKSMSVERDIRFDLLARLCPNSTGMFLKYDIL